MIAGHMDDEKGNYFKSRFRSFSNAFIGLFFTLKSQVNFKIQLTAGALAIILGVILKISLIEWCLIIFSVGLVLGMEVLNTSVEILCDKIEEEYNESIKKVKDTAAAAVLIFSISALIIGGIIFIPKILARFI